MHRAHWIVLTATLVLITGCTLTPELRGASTQLDKIAKSLLTKKIEESMSFKDYQCLLECVDTAGPQEIIIWKHNTCQYIFQSETIGIDQTSGKPYRKYRLTRQHRWSFLPMCYIFDVKEIACRHYGQWERMDSASLDPNACN